MERLTIHAAQPYEVLIGEHALGEVNKLIQDLQPKVSSVLLLIDEKVYQLHQQTVEQNLPHDALYVLPQGEKAKTFSVYEKAMGAALEAGLDRHSLIIACGGGAAGDLAGFTAATYMRGIRYIQVPTTILAHDSAVGGKTAINHPFGKNMTGAFHQPSAVVYDSLFLSTLPLREIRSGFAEVIKHALIADPEFLKELIDHVKDLKEIDESFLLYALKKGIQIKGEIVRQDEREQNVRAYLNFGHTYGHAVEAWSGFGDKLHGESVMIGMVYALLLSERKTSLDFNTDEFIGWVKSLSYEIHIDAPFGELLALMKKDKKNLNQMIRFVLLKTVGQPVLTKVEPSELEYIHHSLKRKGEIQ
ncbi:3-dehydroquinate synthase [Jeotgalibacillus malaysiensis]|uniref:3-dehydroquinate synthase n=1 Tax=Jeotgalibacillus malaysiensis TaxID=1508404 RepID=A0A0B5AME9_9BACL|nr:3-dehydroquinate synthase [Jeotgalibacillus malaysiensis]AJD91301.1 3-dehydroquinate synthase [Jeotgalibacillus malaysiensis]